MSPPSSFRDNVTREGGRGGGLLPKRKLEQERNLFLAFISNLNFHFPTLAGSRSNYALIPAGSRVDRIPPPYRKGEKSWGSASIPGKFLASFRF